MPRGTVCIEYPGLARAIACSLEYWVSDKAEVGSSKVCSDCLYSLHRGARWDETECHYTHATCVLSKPSCLPVISYLVSRLIFLLCTSCTFPHRRWFKLVASSRVFLCGLHTKILHPRRETREKVGRCSSFSVRCGAPSKSHF